MSNDAAQDDSGPIPFGDTQPGIDAQTLALINERFDRGRRRMQKLETAVEQVRLEVKDNTDLTKASVAAMKENTDLTREINDVFQVAKSGFLAVARFGR